MALPFVIAVVSTVATGYAAYRYRRKIRIWWKVIRSILKGKKLAVLGERGVGKTHLFHFLKNGTIPMGNIQQTTSPEKFDGQLFQLKELKLNLEDTWDLSGSDDAYAEWQELVLGKRKEVAVQNGSQHPSDSDPSDYVLYLLRADRLIAGDAKVENRVRKDLTHIGQWLEQRSPRPDLFIIGTHCDLDGEFASYAHKMGDYTDNFCKLPIVKDLVDLGGGNKNAKVIVGSMENNENTAELVTQFLKRVVS